jgi:hypothetical protein
MSSKGVSSIKDRCTEEKKAICEKDFYKYFLPKNHTSLSLSKNNKSIKKPKHNSI